MKLKIIIIIAFITANKLFATDYYVSSSIGNDSNDGTTQNTPWKTLAKVRFAIFSPGDVIHFKRGDEWKEGKELFIDEQGTAANPITFTDYGTGTLPTINLLETLPNNLPWVDEGNNIWSIVLDDDLVNTYNISYWSIYSKLQRLMIDGEEVLGAYTTGELGHTVPDFVKFYYEWGNTRILKIYSTINPNNLTIEMSFLEYAIHIEKYGGAAGSTTPNNVIVENFNLIGGAIAGLAVKEGNSIKIQNITVGNMSNYGIYIGPLANNILVSNCTINSQYELDYSQAGTDTGTSNRGPREGFYIRGADYVEFKNSFVRNFAHANINIGWSTSQNPSEHCSFHNNHTTSTLAYGGRTVIERGVHYLEYYNNFIDGSSVENQFSGQNNHIHHNIIKAVKSSPLKHSHSGWGISIFPYSNEEDVIGNIFENNLIIDCESGGLSIQNGTTSIVSNNIFRNNIFVNNGKFINHFSISQNRTSNIDLAIKIADPYDYTANQFIAPITSGNTFVNNLIYVDGTEQGSSEEARFLYHLDDNDPNGWTTTSINLAQFNSITANNDTIDNNIAGNPEFIDQGNDDYHLQSTSPAINTGTSSLATNDYDGNTVPYLATNTDIGVFEYQGALNVIDELDYTELLLFPNPANNILKISKNTNTLITNYVIINTLGQKVLSGTLNSNLEIQIDHLNSGIYFIEISNENQSITKQFIKKQQ